MRKRNISLAVGGATLTLAGGVVAGGYAYDVAQSDRIAKGVSVAGIDVGGMRASAAETVVRRRLALGLQRPVVATYRGRAFTLGASAARVRADVHGMVSAALARSRTGSLPERVLRAARGDEIRANVPLRVTASRPVIHAFVARVASAIDRAPRDASVVATGTSLSVVSSQTGIGVRRAVLAKLVERQLLDPASPHRLAVPTVPRHPRVSTAQLPDRYPAYITISRSLRQLRLWEHLRLARVYTIAVGQIGLETPAGLYHILDKQVNPSWHVPNSPWAGDLAGRVIPPGPDDPLKARWMGIFDGAGIHGTDDIGSLGTAASHGCIRMSIPDVIDLFDRVSVGTPVYVE